MRVLRLLLIEDSPDDAALLIRWLARGGYDVRAERVDDARGTERALGEGEWDLIISDYNLPGFSAHAALKMVLDRGLEVPFIIVSAAIGEEMAVELMKLGAHDYIMKDRLARLAPAIERELRDAEIRRGRRRSERDQRFLAEASAILVSSLDQATIFRGISALVVPAIADACLVEASVPGRSSELVTVAHVRPGKVDTLRRIWEMPGSCPARELLPVERARASGKPQWIEIAGEAGYSRIATLQGQRELLGELGMRSWISLPLVARGESFGVMTLMATEDRRRFSADDLAVMEELARRASLAVENARLYHEAQLAIQMRDEFLSVASHELKTPITPLQLQLQAIMRLAERHRLAETDPRILERMIRTAERSLSRLSRLVEEMLDVSRVSGGTVLLKRERTDIPKAVGSVIQAFQPEIRQAGCSVSLEIDEPVTGEVDPVRFEQVIEYLLSNAIRYGPGGRIIWRVARKADWAVVSVRDEGMGIAEADQSRIFERFERATQWRNFGGLGLGLYLAREVVEAHGGRIHVESELGHGALFVMELPLRAPAVRGPEGESGAA